MKLHLLGEFAFEIDGELSAKPKPKRERLLLAYLALHPPHFAERQRLANLIWENAESDRALFSLRQALASIRREAPSLSPCLVSDDRKTLGLDIHDLTVDVLEFRRLARVSPVTAVELYRGPLLAGLDQEWISPIRSELERLYLTALESIADGSNSRDAVGWLRRALEVDPFSEQVQQKLFIRLAECGDSAGLTASYRRFQMVLHQEMNAQPSTETERLYQRLLNASPVAPHVEPERGSVRHSLPVPATALIGREGDIAEVIGLFEESQVVSLLGPGGVGKTRLAIAAAETMIDQFQSGVWFVDLASLSDADLVSQAIGQALGLRERPDGEWLDLLKDILSGPKKLLVLDNCEHIVEACASVADSLVRVCRNLSILATSRVPLGLSVEQRFPVESLTLPMDESQDHDWSRYSAIALFGARASRANPKFTITPLNLEAVICVCKQVDAMPLGIEMAAATLAALSIDDVKKRLEQTQAFLRSPFARTVPRHRTLSSVIDWSYSLLNEDDRMLLRRLSVFSGWWTLEHVEVAFGAESPSPVLDSVINLVEASLIQWRDERYSLFEAVRQFAKAQLVIEGEEAHARDRHLDCINIRYEGARESWHGPDAGKAAGRYEADLDNSRIALEWSIESEAIEQGLRLVANAAIVMGMLGLDSNAWLARMLAINVPDAGSDGRMAALRTACWSYGSAGFGVSRAEARRRALNVVEEFATLSRSKNNLQCLGWALAWQGQMLFPNDPERAQSTLVEALELNAKTDDRATETFLVTTLAWLAVYRGEYDEASLLADRALEMAQLRSDNNMISGVRTLQGALEKERGAHALAQARLEEARKIAHASRSDYAVRCASQLLAELHIDSGEWALLAEELARAIPGARQYSDWLSSDQVEMISRYLAIQQGRISDAARGLSELVAAFVRGARELPSPGYRWAALGLETLAQCLSECDRKVDAAKVYGAAQGMAARDAIAISPSIRKRWARFGPASGPAEFDSAHREGLVLTADQAIHIAQELEPLVLKRLTDRI